MFFLRILVLFSFAFASYGEEDFDKQQIIERIKPVGQVNIEGKTTDKKASPTQVGEPAPQKAAGQVTYENHCVACHGQGVAGAPKFRDEADWKPRLAKAKIEGLTASAIKGLNAMPPKGTCGECSEEEIKNAIEYMLPKK